MYLTYNSYTDMGGSVPAAQFTRLEAQARQLIDAATHGRVRGENPTRDAVRYCTYSLIELIQAQEATHGRAVVSESNDGVSVSYSAESANHAQTAQAILRQWLLPEVDANGVSLLYAGVV